VDKSGSRLCIRASTGMYISAAAAGVSFIQTVSQSVSRLVR
jgi:hypothetical protein